MAQTKINWNFYVVLTAIAIVGLGFWLVIVPQLKSVEEINQDISQKTRKFEAANKRRELVDRAKTLITKQPNDFRILTLALPLDHEVGGILVTLEAVAAKHGVSVKAIEPGVADAAVGVLPVTMKIQADYQNLIDFMNGLQSNLRPVKIKSATLLKQIEGSTLDATFIFNVLFVPKPVNESSPGNDDSTQAQSNKSSPSASGGGR